MHEIDQTKLTDQTKFRLCEIKKIDNCFVNDINQQNVYSKKLSRLCYYFWLYRHDFNRFKCNN